MERTVRARMPDLRVAFDERKRRPEGRRGLTVTSYDWDSQAVVVESRAVGRTTVTSWGDARNPLWARFPLGIRVPSAVADGRWDALRGEAVEYLVEVVAVEPVSLARNLVQGGVRYLVGLVDAVLNDDVAIGIAVPYMHGDCDLAEVKPPWFPVRAGGLARRRGRPSRTDTREVISQCGTNLRALDDRDVASR